MRITGGQARSIVIKTLPIKEVRPATDFARERLFGYLGAELLQGARVLDLFAGFGSYGLEALSRGAQHAVFVDTNTQALACIQETHERVSRSLGETPSIETLRQNAYLWTPPTQAFDLIFADPPYSSDAQDIEKLFPLFERALEPSPRARLVIELPSRVTPPESKFFALLRHFAHKKTHAPALAIYETTAQT